MAVGRVLDAASRHGHIAARQATGPSGQAAVFFENSLAPGLAGGRLSSHMGLAGADRSPVGAPVRKAAARRGGFRKKPLTVGHVLHIWRFTDGAGFCPTPLRLSQPPAGVPDEHGRERCRLFDIVGLDEGTCGRRPRSPRSSRPRRIGKAKSFHGSPVEACFGGRLYMSRYISTVYVMCRNGSLKPALEVRGFPAGAGGRTST